MMDGHHYTACFEAPGGLPVLHVYPDPKTHDAPFTVGLGHTGPDVCEGDVWTEQRCWDVFYADYAKAEKAAELVVQQSAWFQMNEPRRAVLTDMAFNIGQSGLAAFHQMLAAIRLEHWQKAHDELLDSDYATQVKGRAETNAKVLLTGEWP